MKVEFVVIRQSFDIERIPPSDNFAMTLYTRSSGLRFIERAGDLFSSPPLLRGGRIQKLDLGTAAAFEVFQREVGELHKNSELRWLDKEQAYLVRDITKTSQNASVIMRNFLGGRTPLSELEAMMEFGTLPGFRDRYERNRLLTEEFLSRYMFIGNVPFRRSLGVAWKVFDSSTGVRVWPVHLVDGSEFDKPTNRFEHFFPAADLDGALDAADYLAKARNEHIDIKAAARGEHVDFYPFGNLRISESFLKISDGYHTPDSDLFARYSFRKAAVSVMHAVGQEIARRIKNNEESLFTDDPSIRYAFDRLAQALRNSSSTTMDDGHVEDALEGLLGQIRRDTEQVNAIYRNLTTKYDTLLASADLALERWSMRDIAVAPMESHAGATQTAKFERS